jgi:acyl-CoA synthetase (AMP-forming)/AMP-acid ligase II
MNIVEPILFQCKSQPLALAVHAPGTLFNQVSYGELEKMIHNVGRRAREQGLARGNVAALFIRDPILHVAVILGLTKIGVVTVTGRDLELPKELSVDATLADFSLSGSSAGRVILVDKDWTAGDGAPVDEAATEFSADAPCRIILTSGSTGYPKAVLRANKHVSARVYRLQTAYGNRFPDCSRIFVDVGLSTGIGLTIFIYTLWRGGSLFLRGPKATDLLEALSFYKVQAMVASPRSLAELVEFCDSVPGFSSGMDVVVSTGSLLTRTLAERTCARLAPNVVCSYGSTEAGVAASGAARAIAKIDGAVGYVAPGVQLDIVDPSGSKLPAGQEGLIRIRSECVVDGYVGDPETTRRRFREGGFYPGDIGRVTADGMLVISGREQAIINLGGDKISPERIEAALTSFPAVTDAAAVAAISPTDVQILIGAVVWRAKPAEQELREHLRHRLPLSLIPKLFVALDSIPRNSSGKIDRMRLKDVLARRSTEQQ